MRTFVERLISRWAISASQRQLHSVILCALDVCDFVLMKSYLCPREATWDSDNATATWVCKRYALQVVEDILLGQTVYNCLVYTDSVSFILCRRFTRPLPSLCCRTVYEIGSGAEAIFLLPEALWQGDGLHSQHHWSRRVPSRHYRYISLHLTSPSHFTWLYCHTPLGLRRHTLLHCHTPLDCTVTLHYISLPHYRHTSLDFTATLHLTSPSHFTSLPHSTLLHCHTTSLPHLTVTIHFFLLLSHTSLLHFTLLSHFTATVHFFLLHSHTSLYFIVTLHFFFLNCHISLHCHTSLYFITLSHFTSFSFTVRLHFTVLHCHTSLHFTSQSHFTLLHCHTSLYFTVTPDSHTSLYFTSLSPSGNWPNYCVP